MKRIIVVGLLILIVVIGFAGWFVRSDTGMNRLFEQETVAEREATQLLKAQELQQSGDSTAAADIYTSLAAETEDNFVYEQAVREKSNIAAQANPDVYIQGLIAQANDNRLRATVRAGAIEFLAREYLLPSKYTKEELHEQIFAQAPFARLVTDAEYPEYVYLLEYGNSVAVRPVASAMLAAYYAEELYKGNTRIAPDVKEMLDIVEIELPYIAKTSPNLPLVELYAAVARMYMEAAGTMDETKLAAEASMSAFEAARSHVDFVTELVATSDGKISFPDITISAQSPLFACTTLFTTLNAVPVNGAMNEMIATCSSYVSELKTKSDMAVGSELYTRFENESANVLLKYVVNN